MMFTTTPTLSTTVQGFFKTATTRYNNNFPQSNLNEADIHYHNSDSELFISLPTTAHHISPNTYTHHHNNTSSLATTTMNIFSQESSKSNNAKKNIHGMTEQDIKSVIYNTESFHYIQEQLRNDYRAQTNGMVKHVAIVLIREQYMQQKQMQMEKELKQRQEDRKLQIARELTEARIKSRQALKLTDRSNSTESDGGSDHDDTAQQHNGRNHNKYDNQSPTSVMSTVDIPDVTTFKANFADDDSEDGDILEMEDEE